MKIDRKQQHECTMTSQQSIRGTNNLADINDEKYQSCA